MNKKPIIFSLLALLCTALSYAVVYDKYPPTFRTEILERLERAKPIFGKSDTVSVIFIGDVMLHSRQMNYPYKPFLEGIKSRLSEADIAIANMEFTLGGKPYSGYPAFSAPDEYAHYVADCGIDIFLTANNHILDKGKSGVERTLKIYDQMEEDGLIRHTGTNAGIEDKKSRYPLIINRHGIRIAFVNFTYGTNVPGSGYEWPSVNRINKDDIKAAVTRAKEKKADFIVALPHWGEEYKLKHNSSQESLAKWLIDEGVDAVIGSHPHVVQDSCIIDGSPVFYSIGNAVSNMSASNTQLELAVTLRFVRDSNGDCKMLDSEVTYLWCSLPGMFKENYATIAVSDYVGKRDVWANPADYDKMMSTYRRVSTTTGVTDKSVANKLNNIK